MKATTLPTLRERWEKLSQEFDLGIINCEQEVIEYDKFIQFTGRTLQLGDFITCDKDGKPMDKPEEYDVWIEANKPHTAEDDHDQALLDGCKEYQKTLDACIFEGWELQQVGDTSGNLVWTNLSIRDITRATAFKTDPIFFQAKFKSIEDLITAGIPLTLKPNHAKELNL